MNAPPAARRCCAVVFHPGSHSATARRSASALARATASVSPSSARPVLCVASRLARFVTSRASRISCAAWRRVSSVHLESYTLHTRVSAVCAHHLLTQRPLTWRLRQGFTRWEAAPDRTGPATTDQPPSADTSKPSRLAALPTRPDRQVSALMPWSACPGTPPMQWYMLCTCV